MKSIQYFIFRSIYIWLICCCFNLNTSAQNLVYPVQVYTQLMPPYTPYVPAYYSGGSEKLKVTIINADMKQPTIKVYLKMKITSSSFSIVNPQYSQTPVFEIQAGVPTVLSMTDLQPYFRNENVTISGNRNQFLRTQMLPDNFYRFHFEVYEANTNRLLSNVKVGYAQALIAAGDPPILNLPKKGEIVKESNIPNILFTWTPRHMNSVAAAYGTEYEISLVEIYDKSVSAENAFQYSRVLFKDRTRSTSFIYTSAQPMLQAGMRYAWRVQAIAKEGIEDAQVFKNDGYSEVFYFDYKGNCPVVTTSGVLAQGMEAKITWETNGSLGYTVEYRKQGSNRWYTGNISDNSSYLYSLESGVTYEYRIGNRCYANDLYEYSEIKAFTMPLIPDKNPQCGILPDANLTDQTPASTLIPGLPIFAGDFPVFITEVTGSNGRFSGKGYVGIPIFHLPRVNVTFENILVNKDLHLIDGFVRTKFDLKDNLILDVDRTLTGGKNEGVIDTGREKAGYNVDYVIDPSKKIEVKPLVTDSVSDQIKGSDAADIASGGTNTGGYELVIVDDQGKSHTQKVDKLPVTISDSNNKEGSKTYEIDKDGNIKVISSDSGIKIDPQTAYKVGTDMLQVKFFEVSGVTKYLVDQYESIYSKVPDYFRGYKDDDKEITGSAKFMLPGESDIITVKLENKQAGFDPSKVSFVTTSGKKYESVYFPSGEEWRVTLLGSSANDGQELLVVYETEAGKYATVALLNIFTYKLLSVNVQLVPVNGTKHNIDLQAIKDIYQKVGITVNISEASNFDYPTLKGKSLGVSGSGLFSTETDDMKALYKAYNSHLGDSYKGDTYYLFMLDNADNKDKQAPNGDMPRGKQFGYLFSGANATTVAHELGHGVFNLEHPFARPAGLKSFSEDQLQDNLMHYHDGTRLAKMQWDQTRDPGLVIGLFEKDKDGMSDRVKDIDVFLKWLKDNIGNTNVSYNQNQFYDSHVVLRDVKNKVESLGITLYIDFGKSGNLNLGKTETGGIPAFGVDFELENTYHNGFYFKIKYSDKDEDAIKIWFYSYEHFSTFLSYLGIKITDPVRGHLIDRYTKLIEKAGDDCDKLDVIYETIPDFVAKAIPDETLYRNLEAFGNCSIGNYNFKKLWWGATDKVQALINILNGFDRSWIYNKVNSSSVFLEKLLREKIGIRANSIDKFLLTVTQIAGENWEEGNLSYSDYILTDGSKIDTQADQEKLIRLGVQGQVSVLDKSVFVKGCVPSEIGNYKFGNQVLIENPIFAAGSIYGCSDHIHKKALEPIVTEDANAEILILPALVVKYLLEESDRKAINEILNTHISLLLPEVLVKPATLTKWSKFFKGKGGQVVEVADRLRKKLQFSDLSRVGKHGGTVVFDLVDETNKIVGQLKRVPGAGGVRFSYYYTDYIGGKNLIKNHQYDLNSIFEIATNRSHPDLLITNNKNVLYGDLELPININENISGLGRLMFDDALTYFMNNKRVDGIYGYWIKKAGMYENYGGQSINLTRFNEALKQGFSKEEAAFKTITGEWAKQNGFIKVEFIGSPTETKVNVIFSK